MALIADERAMYEHVIEQMADYIRELQKRCGEIATVADGNAALEYEATATYEIAGTMLHWAERVRQTFGRNAVVAAAPKLPAMPLSETRH